VAGSRTYFRLPPIIRCHDVALIYLLIWTPYIAVYQALNRWPLRTPFTLPFTWADHLVPFVPALLPVYIAYLPFYFLTVARSENDREANRVFYGTHLQLLLSVPFFALLPVTMPRGLFYGPETYGWADAFWRWFDAPNNCFPSLHASNTLLLMQFNWRRPHRVAYTALGVAIICSAVLVKQHYVVDLVAGAAVYLVARWFLAHATIVDLTPDGWRAPRPAASLERGQDLL
jgi:hypothetical protein